MADKPNGKSDAEVAYQLFLHIAEVEKKCFDHNDPSGNPVADRDWILKAFAASMKAVQQPGYYL